MKNNYKIVLYLILCFTIITKTYAQKTAKKANNNFYALSNGTFLQNWTDASLITTNDNWTNVPSIQGFLGQDITTSSNGADPQLLLTPASSVSNDIDIIANQTNTNINTGGVAEFAITNPVVALQGSGTADAPHLIFYMNSTARQNVVFKCKLRDIDGTDNAIQPIAFHYRVGGTGNFTNLSTAFVADATTGSSIATQETNVTINLPAACNNAAQLEIRVMTTNASGNDEWVGIDDIEISSDAAGGELLPVVSINDVAVTEGNSGTTNMVFTITTDKPVTSAGASFTVSTTPVTASFPSDFNVIVTTVTMVEGQTSAVVTVEAKGDVITEINETFNIIIAGPVGVTIGDGTGVGTIINDDIGYIKINQVQGTGTASLLVNQMVTLEAIVTGDFQNETIGNNRLSGFFIQEEEADYDADNNTSEGIFVFEGDASITNLNVNVGDKVTVTGLVKEFNGLTEITAPIIALVNTGNALPSEKLLTIPATDAVKETLEGMRVNLNQTLTITDNFNFGRLGELGLSINGRQLQYTEVNAPGTGYIGYEAGQIAQRIVLDDDKSGDYRTPILGWAENVGAGKSYFRVGSTINSLSGILDYGFSNYRIRPNTAVTFNPTNPRPTAPVVNGNIKVATMNVLNFFNGPTFPTSRGATTLAAFRIQKAKIVEAIKGLNADVIGLQEIENDSHNSTDSAIDELVDSLNTVLGANTYAFVDPGPGTPMLGTDAIKVAIIYKPAKVSLVGTALTLTTTDALFTTNGNRVPLAQKFKAIAGCEEFTFIVNHFKSKSGAGSGIDADGNDGQAGWNGKRSEMADSLLRWINNVIKPANGPNIIIAGDLNSYEKENPITKLINGGFTNINSEGTSKAFNGLFGDLDYILFSNTMAGQKVDSQKWAINADESPTLFQYTAAASLPGTTYDPTKDAYSSSDHDPIIAGISAVNDALPIITTSIDVTKPVTNQVFTDGCSLLAKVLGGTVAGTMGIDVVILPAAINEAGKVYSNRFYQLNPSQNGSGVVTLYFNQSDFNIYNAANAAQKLPLNAADVEMYKANLRIYKYDGAVIGPSSPASFGSDPTIINPADENIIFKNNRWEVTFDVTSFSGFFLATQDNNTLPLNLIAFNGKLTSKNTIELLWKTSNEKNFAGFELQKLGKNNAFEKLIFINNNSQSNYSFEDKNIQEGFNQYRLKMIDIDGSFEFSKIININTETINLKIHSVFPNPSSAVANVTLMAPNEGLVNANIINLMGKKYDKVVFKVQKGINTIAIPVQKLPSGIYYMEISQGLKVAVHKILVK